MLVAGRRKLRVISKVRGLMKGRVAGAKKRKRD